MHARLTAAAGTCKRLRRLRWLLRGVAVAVGQPGVLRAGRCGLGVGRLGAVATFMGRPMKGERSIGQMDGTQFAMWNT